MDLFSTWSNESLQCLLRNNDLIEYFSNQVIVEDSKQSEWIIFILKVQYIKRTCQSYVFSCMLHKYCSR